MGNLTITFTSGVYTQITFVYSEENLYSDLGALFEEILKEQIIPNKWFGLVHYFEDGDDYVDYCYVDRGYYFYMPNVHVEMMSDEEINKYIENGIQVVRMD